MLHVGSAQQKSHDTERGIVMKRLLGMILIFSICLSMYACGSAEIQESKDVYPAGHSPEDSVQGYDASIEFDSPVVIAEDEYVRVELIQFYQDYYVWSEFGAPVKVSSSTEGARAEKFVVLKFYNKCDHKLGLYMTDIYLGNDGASLYLMAAHVHPDAGKNVTAAYLIRTGAKETLPSIDILYTLEGSFFIEHIDEEGNRADTHYLDFSIPAALS